MSVSNFERDGSAAGESEKQSLPRDVELQRLRSGSSTLHSVASRWLVPSRSARRSGIFLVLRAYALVGAIQTRGCPTEARHALVGACAHAFTGTSATAPTSTSFSFGERSIRSSTSRPGLDGECAARLPSTRFSTRIQMAIWSPPAAHRTTVRVRTTFNRGSGKLRPRREHDSAVAERGEDAIEPEYGTQIPLRQRSCPALATFGAHALHEEAQRRLEPLQSLLELQLWCC